MKIAVACENGKVTGHFGHCESFNIFEVENNKVMNDKVIPNPGHQPGFLPNYLHEMGVNVIISGGMGGKAVAIFNQNQIEVIIGATGDPKENVEKYLAGKLQSAGSICHEHQHQDECHNH